jgi:hypothetical protein
MLSVRTRASCTCVAHTRQDNTWQQASASHPAPHTPLLPGLLRYPPVRVHDMLEFLLHEVGLTGEGDVSNILLAYPRLFELSVEDHAQPVVAFLRTELGLGEEEVRSREDE